MDDASEMHDGRMRLDRNPASFHTQLLGVVRRYVAYLGVKFWF